MMHLTLIDASAHSAIDGLMLYERAIGRPSDKVDAYEVARSIDATHLAADKLVRHLVATLDPLLLVAGLNHETLKAIRAATRHSNAATIFASSAKFKTHDVEQIAKLVQDVTHTSVDPSSYGEFLQALRDVTTLRNHVQHGELFGDPSSMLAAVRRLLAEIGVLARATCPELLSRIESIDGQAVSRLRALKEEVDGAWQVLLDYIAARGTISLPFVIYVDLQTVGASVGMFIAPGPARGGFHCETQVPPSNASGLFALHLSANEIQGRYLRRYLQPASNLGFTPQPISSRVKAEPTSSSSWLKSLIGLNSLLGVDMPTDPAPKVPILAFEDGELQLTAAGAVLSAHLAGVSKRTYLSASVLLSDWRLIAHAQSDRVDVSGIVSSAIHPPDRPPPATLSVQGIGHMTLEAALAEPSQVRELPAGTVWRTFEGELTISSARPDHAPD